ncbi:hypothetical protein SALBM311S_04670 [Streptomyces alboniger]
MIDWSPRPLVGYQRQPHPGRRIGIRDPRGTRDNRKRQGATHAEGTDGHSVRPLGLGLLGLIASTPFVLAALAPENADWGKLSDISQAYGAVSVVLSAIALAGVALSLLYQVRQARTGNEQAIRDSHLQLATLALSNPELLQAWSPPAAPVTLKRHQQHLITSLAPASCCSASASATCRSKNSQ